jgi:hypothetical protein
MHDYLTDDDIVATESVKMGVEAGDYVGLAVSDTGALEIVFTGTEDGQEYTYHRPINDVQASSLALSIQVVLG